MSNIPKRIDTLCVVYEHPRILLGLKKRGFGEGRWNGFGGKVQKGEEIEQAAKRELFEEAGIKVKNCVKAGIIEFEFKGNPEILEVHIFKGTGVLGDLTESEEMKPQWFHIDKLPFENMWPDDKYWYPLFLNNKLFHSKFIFEGQDKILDMDIKEVKEL